MGGPGSRLRTWLGNLVALAASTLLVVLALEFALVPHFLHRLPLKLHERILSPAVRVLAQSSKAGTIPHDYVALVGDSYAAGEGDWRLTVDAGRNPPHTVGHLLHERTGRDVVSFGHAGAGSVRGLVMEPIGSLAYLGGTWHLGIPDPSDIEILFYEGNDFDDNLEHLARRFDPHWDRGRLHDPDYFRGFLDRELRTEDVDMRGALQMRPMHNFLALRSLRWNLERWLEEGELPRTGPRPARPRPARSLEEGKQAGSVLLVDGEAVAAPNGLQGPAPELADSELDDALYVFEQSAGRLRERFPEARIGVLYVPSVLLCYPLPEGPVPVQEDHHRPDRPDGYPGAYLEARSDGLCGDLASASRRLGFAFHDARPGLRAVGARRLIHGPRDWKHLNREGQEALAAEAEALLRAPGGQCAALSGARPAAAASR